MTAPDQSLRERVAAEPTISFGALCKPLREQLAEQGLTVSDPEELARIEFIANAVSTVAIHGLMPRSQSDRARTKLANRLWKIVRVSNDQIGGRCEQ